MALPIDWTEPFHEARRTFTATRRSEVVASAMKQKAVLEWLFPPGWFSKPHENHPAYAEWEICNQIIGWGGWKPDNVKFERMRLLAKVVLDVRFLVSLSDGDLGQLTPGRREAFGDERVQKKISSRILKPDSFEHLLVEIYTAAWHKWRGRNVVMSEAEGQPDVSVIIEDVPVPVYIECKKLNVASRGNIEAVVKHASNQLAADSHGNETSAYGAALLDLTAVGGARFQKDDTIPSNVTDVIKVVGKALRGNLNTHVKTAILVWDDYRIDGRLPDPVTVYSRRRAKIVHHSLNSSPLDIDKLFNGYGAGIGMTLSH